MRNVRFSFSLILLYCTYVILPSLTLFTSLHLTFFRLFHPPFHFVTCITFLILFLKLLGLQQRVPKTSEGSWFQICMVLFTKEYFPISVRCFLLLIFLSWSPLLRCTPIAFHARSPVYALKRAHMRAICLRCVKVPQFKWFLWCACL
jgi:hypothetical protein